MSAHFFFMYSSFPRLGLPYVDMTTCWQKNVGQELCVRLRQWSPKDNFLSMIP